MTHTIDTLMALADAYAELEGKLASLEEIFTHSRTHARELRTEISECRAKLLAALTEALAPQAAPQAVPAGWTSLQDGFPSPYEMVLVARGSHVTTGSYTPAFGWEWEEVDGEDEDSIATHWMPLPAAPAVKGE
jgi:Protein of unknown function (DUF551)